jgi:Ankyrin repeat
MTASKSLPVRPSLESLRKQAKKIARERSVSLRDAQLVLAREYGYAGWRDLTAEVSKRLGKGLEWAVAQARRIIHDNDVERLKQLLAEYPALLSWQDDDEDGGVLGMATDAYADAGDAQREQWFTRGACAEVLIDAGAVVTPSVCDGLLDSRPRGLVQLFHRKNLLPHTLKFLAALGDLDAVRTALDENVSDLKTVNEALVCACRFDQEAVALLLLERSIALDPALGKRIDGSTDRRSFISAFKKSNFAQVAAVGAWNVFVMEQIQRALHERDLPTFVGGLQREPWLLGEAFVSFQNGLIGVAALNDGLEEFIVALFDLDPAILRRRPPPPSQAIEHAFTYANAHLIPLLTRIWAVPDDLPHAAGMGDLARVKRWFDTEGKPALGDLATQAPATSVHPREPQWGDVGVQQVLDTALAWAVINRHFDVADFLLEHGADVSTNWNSHEPASILHHLVFLPNPYESMQYLVDRGIDMTIKDYRWNSTAQGWALHANDEKMVQWLEEAERQREMKR